MRVQQLDLEVPPVPDPDPFAVMVVVRNLYRSIREFRSLEQPVGVVGIAIDLSVQETRL